MKKLLAIVFIFITCSGFSQYYYIPFKNTGQNPGGLNNDPEYSINASFSEGWSVILENAIYKEVWSDTQDIPFPFRFNGKTVSQYKVSNSGVLTFSIGESLVPLQSNYALPTIKIPDNSICVWGLKMKSASAIVAKVFGIMPHRQLWIQFNEYGEENIKFGVTCWSIVLEESSNNIYVVDQKTYCRIGTTLCNENVKLTVGIQLKYPNALQVNGSPDMGSFTNGNAGVSDNTYYKFVYGTQPDYDLGLEKIFMKDKASKSQKSALKGYVRNCGKITVTSFDVNYRIGTGTIQTITVNSNILSGDTCSFSFPDWIPTEAGKYADFTFWTNHINGSQSDVNPSDDTIHKKVFVNNGTSGNKRVLLEEATGTWCGYCPDGALAINEMQQKYWEKMIVLANHGFDTMAIVETDSINSTYEMGYPQALIDRYKWDSNTFVVIDRYAWDLYVNDRINTSTPVNISILNPVYDAVGKTISFDVKTDFVDYVEGDVRISCVMSENWVSNPDPAFDQHNYFSKDIGGAGGPDHPLYNYPEWLNASDSGRNWFHQHVTRAYLTDVWGDPVDTNNTKPHMFSSGNSFTRHYSINANPVWNPNQLQIVAFVSFFNDNLALREVLNATEQKLTTTGIIVRQNTSSNLKIYPNPVQNILNIDFTAEKASIMSVKVYDMLGNLLVEQGAIEYPKGAHNLSLDTSILPDGIYMIVLDSGSTKMNGKFIKQTH